jgi:hypothetical protein
MQMIRTARGLVAICGGIIFLSTAATVGDAETRSPEFQADKEASKCWKMFPGVGYDDLITATQCEISVYQRYGLAEKVAKKKEELAKAEEQRRRSQMDAALSKCWDPANPKSTVVTSYACRVEVFTRYGMATELAKAKQELAKAEEDQAKTDERTRQDLAKAAEAKRQKELWEAKHKERCQQAPGARIGMTEIEVLASNWGPPSDRHTTTDASHHREQWVYTGGPDCGPKLSQSYLYFQDGILTTIQER